MAQVRIPKAIECLLPFCRPWAEKRDNACFATYAELMVFAAGFGFKQLKGAKPPQCAAFIDGRQPYPIDFGVFKSESQRLYPLILMLALAAYKKHEIVREEDRLVKVLEDYAGVGLKGLAEVLANSTPESFHVEMAQLILEASRESLKAK